MISPGGQAELLLQPADVCLGPDCWLPVGGKTADTSPAQTFYAGSRLQAADPPRDGEQ